LASTGIDRHTDEVAQAREADALDTHLVAAPGQARRIFDLIGPSAAAAGFEIVRVRYGLHDGHTLQIMAERPDGSMRVEDCEEL